MSGFLAIPVVAACIVDRKKVLLTRRFSPLHLHLHKKWDYPGGKIEVGERPEGASAGLDWPSWSTIMVFGTGLSLYLLLNFIAWRKDW